MANLRSHMGPNKLFFNGTYNNFLFIYLFIYLFIFLYFLLLFVFPYYNHLAVYSRNKLLQLFSEFHMSATRTDCLQNGNK